MSAPECPSAPKSTPRVPPEYAVLGGALGRGEQQCTQRDTLQVEGEAELLLPAGIALKITGVLPKDASGLTIITCEDDDDAPTLIS